MTFKNRKEAGEKLAEALLGFKNAKNTLVLALPRGGVVVGYEISQALNLPLDIVVPRKIGAPSDPEYAIGAITESGEGIFNTRELAGIDQDWFKKEVEKEKKEAERRLKLYRGNRPYSQLLGKIVIIVDDGVATGYTMRAALKSVRGQKPQKIIVAVPHGAKDSLEQLRKEADEVISLIEPEWYGAVGMFYEEFPQTTDKEVIQLLGGVGRKETLTIKHDEKRSIKFRVFILILIAAAGLIINEVYLPHTKFLNAQTVEIAPGLGPRKIAELLKQNGVIRSRWTFILYTALTGRASDLKPGNYVFFNSAAIPSVVRDLVRGGTNEIALTIPEGWSTKDIARYLESRGLGTYHDLLKLISVQPPGLDKFDFLKDKPKNAGLEGYLFPDTYRVFKNAVPEDIVVKMLENFDKKLGPELRQEISRQGKTTFEIITTASLIEKEVVSDEDRALVSGILWKRLETGVGLQVDATINYITGKKTTKISREETQIDSLYNTYKYRGLPPGPIANPGLSAIRAAIYPQESPYLYYLSTPNGQTIFSTTLEEHNLAKAKYLK
ncbi:MAG: endolytic transglycosylase MltG [Candidatus Sungiibacteriota bacterium]|uniref:Endolytic murein transglycosylase n=1 Tax=Candidatus Sungiibacteriota bacterium TaxID=2750080 RepID=A0A7T5RK43_9BACT|nr:MAG: endolytic transglycosylase MltG [Candidatus Sungbacteria bacterium]